MIFDKFINKNNIKKYNSIADDVDKMFEKETAQMTIEQLREALLVLKNTDNKQMDKKKKTIRALAIAKSASQQVLGMTYYRVQLLGGMALIDGNMAEMKTGEGKTLTCSIATITNFALGFKTHVITANEYLSTRDEETLKPLYSALGIKSATNVAQQSQEEKKEAYACDILYSTASELGFDYLRDNLVQNIEEKVQPLNFKEVKIIIDEADFVLIDEATTPLIISGQKPLKDLDIYFKIRDMVADFTPVSLDPHASRIEIDSFKVDGDFWLDKKSKRTFLSDIGFEKLEQRVVDYGILSGEGADIDLYHEKNNWLVNEICQCLNANFIYERDKDYVVMDDEIVIVDPNTGRLSVGRSWSNGLHQAIQAKEAITVKPENTTTGTITIQNYLKLYFQISGMSGTIMQSTEEFEQIYNCSTISIHPNKPSRRIDEPDHIYKNAQDKYNAMIEEVISVHKRGQPILIGTVSVAESEIVSEMLRKANLPHQVINAKNHELEAKIIAQAGQPKKITVATSMAGRGTDIILGGNKEAIIKAISDDYSHVNERIEFIKYLIEEEHGELHIELNSAEFAEKTNLDYTKNNGLISLFYDAKYLEISAKENPQRLMQNIYQLQHNLIEQLKVIEHNWDTMKEEVLSLGGLCVIGSSRNVSVRIDNQLIGRAGRQGDPGRSIFFMSLEDPWIKVFGNTGMMNRVAQSIPDGHRMDTPMIRKIFKRAQTMSEGQNFEARKSTFQYDSVSDEGRNEFFKIRNTFLLNKESSLESVLISELTDKLSPITNSAFETFLESKFDTQINDGLAFALEKSIPELLELTENFKTHEEFGMYDARDNNPQNPDLQAKINSFVKENRMEDEDKKYAFAYTSYFAIPILDDLWADHLSYIDTAKKSVGYASLVQKNPLHEYRKLCFESFSFLFNNFTAKCLDNYLQSYLHREELQQEAISKQKALQAQLDQMRYEEEQKRIQEETDDLLINPFRHHYEPKELIEQPIPEILYHTDWSQHENGAFINDKDIAENIVKQSPFDNASRTIREGQRLNLIGSIIGNRELPQDFVQENSNLVTTSLNNEDEDDIVDAIINTNPPMTEFAEGISFNTVDENKSDLQLNIDQSNNHKNEETKITENQLK